MTQGAPVLAGMINTANQTTNIELTGPNPGLSVLCGTAVGSTNTAWCGIAANSYDPGSDALYGIGRGRGVYAVGLDGEGVSARSYTNNGTLSFGRLNGVKGTTANPAAAGVWGENTASGQGVLGTSEGGIGVLGRAIGASPGVLGENTSNLEGGDRRSRQGDWHYLA